MEKPDSESYSESDHEDHITRATTRNGEIMKQTFLNTAFILAVMTFAISNVTAQITINIPGIKKIKKPVITTDTNVTDNRVTTNTTNTTNTTTGNSTNWWVDYQIEAITKYKQQLDSWNPDTQIFPKPNSSDDYISLALSKKERASWLSDKKVQPDAKLDASLDELKASLSRRLPEYTINKSSFANRNAAEEKMMLAQMTGVPGIKVFKIGLNQAAWLIDKNEWGIPKARYKHGMIYGRNPNSEDQFCRIWYVNVVQEYSGAGTYGATQARYIDKEFIACPAGL